MVKSPVVGLTKRYLEFGSDPIKIYRCEYFDIISDSYVGCDGMTYTL